MQEAPLKRESLNRTRKRGDRVKILPKTRQGNVSASTTETDQLLSVVERCCRRTLIGIFREERLVGIEYRHNGFQCWGQRDSKSAKEWRREKGLR